MAATAFSSSLVSPSPCAAGSGLGSGDGARSTVDRARFGLRLLQHTVRLWEVRERELCRCAATNTRGEPPEVCINPMMRCMYPDQADA